jgi:CheY-like chemotaxis protein/two-component sensor histidine kinase
LRAAVELLTHCALADPDAATAADTLVRQADSLDRLTGDLLDLARISRGTLRLNREPVPLERVVRQALEEVRPALQARRHELSVTLPPEPVWLEADALRLVQVLVNLLDNAGKYTAPGGRITLAVSRDGDSAVLRVRDTGIGIPPDELPRLFGLFTRLGATVDPTYTGMGIGLALVRSLVELHGGSVEACSEGRGKGSEFVVRLPVRPAPPATAPPPPVESPAAPPCRVVLADDSDGFAASCARLLRRRGHEVLLAGDGEEALKLVHEVRPDVLLLDIRLPGLDGYEVARRLRSAPGLEGVRIVGITGFGDEQHRRQAEQAGFDELLTKPLRLADLERALAGRTTSAAAT